MDDSVNPFASPQTSAVDPPVTAWAAENPLALRRVKLGLLLVYIGICGLLIAGLAFPGLMMTGGPEQFLSFSVIVAVVIMGLTLLMFLGQVFCIAAPKESGAKPLIIAAVVLQGLSFLASLVLFVLPDASLSAIATTIGSNIVAGASLICFILFLRKFAQYLQRPDIARRAMRSLIVGLVSLAIVVICGVVVATSPLNAGPVGLVMFIGIIGMLIALVMYANTVTYLRKAIAV